MEPIFPRDEYELRWQRTYDEMARRGFETAVVWGRSGGAYDAHFDTFYLSGYYSNHSGTEVDSRIWSGHGHEAVILHRGQEPSVHGTEAIAVEEAFHGDWHAHAFLADGIADFLNNQLKVKGRVALVGTTILPLKYGQRLMALTPDIEWVPQDNLVASVTRKKSDREVEAFREAGEITTKAMNSLAKDVIAGKRQTEAVAGAAKILIEHGSNMHFCRLVSGKGPETNRSFDHILLGYADKTPAKGDLARLCLTTISAKGYWMDPLRTVVCGNKPTKQQREIVEGCAEIVSTIAAAHGPGVRLTDLWALTRETEKKVIDRIDWMEANDDKLAEQWPIFGHDLSILWRSASAGEQFASDSPDHPCCFPPDLVLEENMVQTVEYFFGADEVGYAMFEQNFIINAEGIELITKSPMIFWD